MARPDLWTAIRRGLVHRCPICGEGKLFRAYLKVSDRCRCCGAPLAEYRADDGPAWATILLVGHLIMPFFILTVRSGAPDWVDYAVMLPLTIALALGLLPRVKGVFVALLWSFGIKNGVPGGSTEIPPR